MSTPIAICVKRRPCSDGRMSLHLVVGMCLVRCNNRRSCISEAMENKLELEIELIPSGSISNRRVEIGEDNLRLRGSCLRLMHAHPLRLKSGIYFFFALLGSSNVGKEHVLRILRGAAFPPNAYLTADPTSCRLICMLR